MASTAFVGTALPNLSTRKAVSTPRSLTVVASGAKKINTKTPLGPSGDTKIKVDASGRKTTGKGTYQFVKKYGANVDGYSPIFTPDEWSAKGDTFEGGPQVLALWAVTFGALLLVGVILIFSTSALA